jgi:tRNA1(Val) A37 N6-methylase TrmN6
MKIERIWAMPNKWTFTIKPIRRLLEEEVGIDLFQNGLWCDPFAGMNSPAQIRNDINPEMNAQFHMDAIDFLKQQPDEGYDGVLLDPPYSNRQVSEHYKEAGIKVTGWHTSSGWGKTIRDEAARIVKKGGKVICFGWNSMGMGLNRGFEMKRILLVPHGGNKNDTIVTVEEKV